MQLTLAFLNPREQSPESPASIPAPTAWDDIDEPSRLTALAVLARIIAQMLAAERETGASDD